MPRKRFSAFEDFPGGEQPPSTWDPNAEDQPAPETHHETETSSLFGSAHILSEPSAPQVERIERLKPSQMIPDRFQPRRLLPTALRQPFFTGKIDCYQAARQWLQMAKSDTGVQKEVDRLLAMGFSFEEHGQIKPITGNWVESPSGDFVFQIETGERRFWASCLQYVSQKLREEPLLRVEVVAAPTRMRQVLENRHAEPPSAVGQACEVASLILAELGKTPDPGTSDEFSFFRQWRAQRMPTGMWEKLTPVMQLTRERMVQLLNILELPTNLLDLADRYRVPERVLREVLRAGPNRWEPLLIASIQNDWTSDDVAVVTDKAPAKGEKKSANPPDPYQQSINALHRFARAFSTLDEDTRSLVLDELATDIVVDDLGEDMQRALRELAELIRVRQQGKVRRR